MLSVLCQVGGRAYAIPANCVCEVVPLAKLHPVAHAPPWHAGLLIHRGRATPVVDFAQLAGEPAGPPRLSSRIVVVDAECGGCARRLGLLVERVDLREVQDRRGDDAHRTRWGRLILADGGAYELIELDRLLPAERRAALFVADDPGE